jgi:hypothetical protein
MRYPFLAILSFLVPLGAVEEKYTTLPDFTLQPSRMLFYAPTQAAFKLPRAEHAETSNPFRPALPTKEMPPAYSLWTRNFMPSWSHHLGANYNFTVTREKNADSNSIKVGLSRDY